MEGMFLLWISAFVYQGRGSDATSAASYQMQSIAVVLLGGCAFSGGIVEPVGVVAESIHCPDQHTDANDDKDT